MGTRGPVITANETLISFDHFIKSGVRATFGDEEETREIFKKQSIDEMLGNPLIRHWKDESQMKKKRGRIVVEYALHKKILWAGFVSLKYKHIHFEINKAPLGGNFDFIINCRVTVVINYLAHNLYFHNGQVSQNFNNKD